jgi:RNA polymerase sigma factor (sigma-70 family)
MATSSSFPYRAVRMERKSPDNRRCTVQIDLALLRRYQDSHQQALDDLWEFHFALVYFWAGKVARKVPRANLDDLRQEACVAFIVLAGNFDTSKNENFHGHIRVTIKATLYLSPEIRVVKRTLYLNYRKVKIEQEKWAIKFDRKPTVKELSQATGLTERQVNNALYVMAAFPFQFDETEGDAEFEDPHQSDDPYQSKLLEDAINQLKPEYAEVIIRQFFLEHPQQKIADELGTTVGAIKMRVKRAIINLRKIISA